DPGQVRPGLPRLPAAAVRVRPSGETLIVGLSLRERGCLSRSERPTDYGLRTNAILISFLPGVHFHSGAAVQRASATAQAAGHRTGAGRHRTFGTVSQV